MPTPPERHEKGFWSGLPPGFGAAAGLLVVVLVGLALIVAGFKAISGPPQPKDLPTLPPVKPGATAAGGKLYLERSQPTRIDISNIDVRAPIRPMGVQRNGEIEIPPLSRPHLAGWYRDGASPGEIGSSVIVGHVDSSRTGEAVFYALGSLEPGASIDVTRSDDTIATFRVDSISSFSKAKFPGEEVYGPTDYAALRLITCGGTFDAKSREYTNNVVVFASLTETRQMTEEDRQRPLRNYIPKKKKR